MIRTKKDVEFHYEGYESKPAVNVKVYKRLDSVTLPLELGGFSDDGGKTWQVSVTHEGFTHDWVDAHIGDDQYETWWGFAVENGWEYLQSEAEEIWGTGVKVYSEGRSGGWAVVHGIDDFDTWDAIALSKWRQFATSARAAADDIPRSMLDLIYANVYEPALSADEALLDVRDWRQGVELQKEAQVLHDN